jgi:diguanylate cyclase (GGDEF)-like protein
MECAARHRPFYGNYVFKETLSVLHPVAIVSQRRAHTVGTISYGLASQWNDPDVPRAEIPSDGGIRSEFAALAHRNEELEATNQQLALEVGRLESLALLDPLTGLGNRRHFDECLVTEIGRAARGCEPLTLLICDVDGFKQCNDTYGHMTGDALLIAIGNLLKRYCRRGGDLAFRHAGDEFALLLPNVSRHAARGLANRLGAATRELTIDPPSRSALRFVTLSIGGVTFADRRACAPGHLVNAADQALYRAKRAGRDCVQFASARAASDAALEFGEVAHPADEAGRRDRCHGRAVAF